MRDPTNMTASRLATPVEVTSAFLVTNDAIVGDWFERAGHTLAFRVCGRATSMVEASELIPASDATVLVIDQDLADGSGLELVRRLRGSGVATPMLVMTAMPVPGINEGAQRAGATGTVVRSGRADDVAWAISAVARHRTIWDERNPALALASPRELEVLVDDRGRLPHVRHRRAARAEQRDHQVARPERAPQVRRPHPRRGRRHRRQGRRRLMTPG